MQQDIDPWLGGASSEPESGELEGPIVETVNFHIMEPCNMGCHFCFATFQDSPNVPSRGHLPLEEAVEVVQRLARHGFKKINFAGGEPFLYKGLGEVMKAAKAINPDIQISITTNGSFILKDGAAALRQFMVDGVSTVDIIALSIDSLNPRVSSISGRSTKVGAMDEEDYFRVGTTIMEAGIDLKVNTVVTSLNWDEDLRPLVSRFVRYGADAARRGKGRLLRHKIFQVSVRDDQKAYNEIAPFLVEPAQLDHFIITNMMLMPEGLVKSESEDEMEFSYAMVDPSGRFFSVDPNADFILEQTRRSTAYVYSDPIHKVGVRQAIRQVTIKREDFLERDGHYQNAVSEIERVAKRIPFLKNLTEKPRPPIDSIDYDLKRYMAVEATISQILVEMFAGVGSVQWQYGEKQAGRKFAHLYAPLLDSKKDYLVRQLTIIKNLHPYSSAGAILTQMENLSNEQLSVEQAFRKYIMGHEIVRTRMSRLQRRIGFLASRGKHYD